MRTARCNCRFSFHARPPAMHAPDHTHTPCHACPPYLLHMPPCHACLPPAMHAPPPTTHATPAMHAYPLPCMPPPHHTRHPCHACLPPAMHAPPPPPHTPPLPCMLPCHICHPRPHHAHPPAMHVPPPPVDRILDTLLWKYYLATFLLQAVKMSMIKKKVYREVCWMEHESSRQFENNVLNATSLVPHFVPVVVRTPCVSVDFQVWRFCLMYLIG